MPLQFWASLFYLAVVATAVTFFLLQHGSLHLPAPKVMAYTYLTPSWVIGWEFILTGGLPRAVIFVGVGMSVLSLLMLLRER